MKAEFTPKDIYFHWSLDVNKVKRGRKINIWVKC